MTSRYLLLAGLSGLAAFAATAEFHIEDNGAALTILDGANPVLVYNYAPVEPPEGVAERFRRADYIHPLYGLDGEILTDDFPADHYHHRGVFWAWPASKAGERKLDVWTLDGARARHEGWLERRVDNASATVGAVNVWVLDDAPEKPVVREEVTFTVWLASAQGRPVDFVLRFENVSPETVTIQGSLDKDKGYGGFSFRPPAKHKPFTFTTSSETLTEDQTWTETPWMDISYRARNTGEYSGVAIFQHPANPGYPHGGWLNRHYGYLGASWPHTAPHVLQPGESVTLRYRLYVHRGGAKEGGVREAFEAFILERSRTEGAP